MTKPQLSFVSSLLFGLMVAAPAAQAQMEPAPVDPVAAGIGGPELSQLVPPMGALSIRVPLAIGLSSGNAGEPISIPADIYFSVSDALTVGISHSGGVVQAVQPYLPGLGICMTGDDGGCFDGVYNNVGIDAIYQFLPGVIQLAAHGGFEITSIDPMWLALRIGLLAQAPLGANIAILSDPRLFIGLNERDFNQDVLALPLAVQFWATPAIRLAGRTEITGPLDGFGDYFRGSLGAFAGFGINDMIEAFVSFDFLNLYGEGGGADFRSLVVGANFNY